MATLRRLPLLLLLAGAALVLALRRRVEAYEESGSPGSHRRHARVADVDAIIVLAGGVDASGRPHETVLRRLRAAARLHKKEAAATGRLVPILCNGGGTTHKPKWVDGQGYAVAEAALMAGVLARELGVPWSSIFAEGYSDDTVGNAFFARVMHMDARPDWRRLLIITSEFQIGRTRAIYDWVFSLPIAPLPTGAPPAPSPGTRYALDYLAVDDAGALPEQADSLQDRPSASQALVARRAKERTSLRSFSGGALPKMASLQQLHDWVFTAHSAYAPAGVLAKRAMNDSNTAASY